MIEHTFHGEIHTLGILLILAAVGCAVYFIATIEVKRRAYRRLWCEEAKRHALARTELAEMDRTAHLMGDCCAQHVRTIAKLKQEVTKLHEQIAAPKGYLLVNVTDFQFGADSAEVGVHVDTLKVTADFQAFDGIKVEEARPLFDDQPTSHP